MGCLSTWCIIGLLVLSAWTRAEKPSDDDDDDDKSSDKKGCVTITLRSTDTKVGRKEIRDLDDEPADIISVKVLKALTKTKCEEDETYFIDGSFINVKKGCSARFRVCYRTTKQPLPTAPSGCTIVRLLSRLNREVDQTLDSRVASMRLAQQHEEGERCRSGVNYGFKGKRVYANDGCRGDFIVCFRRGQQPGQDDETDNDDDDDDDDGDNLCTEINLRSTRKGRKERRIRDSRYNYIRITSVKVVDLRSDVKCQEGRTYDFNDTYVSAYGGCSARFRVCYERSRPRPRPGATAEPGCLVIKLLSTQNKDARKKISTDQGTIRSISVLRQENRVRCVRNSNYGFRKNEVYARGGCRGEFQVCLSKQASSTRAPRSTCVKVTLESWGPNEPDSKTITNRSGEPAYVQSISLQSELSDDECEDGKTFFSSGFKVHAINGCRGKFLVCHA